MTTSTQHTPHSGPTGPAHDPAGRFNTAACDGGRDVRPFTSDPSLPGLSFVRVLRSELIKLRAMRSTLWLALTTVVLTGLMVTMLLFSLAWLLAEQGDFVDVVGRDVAGQELLNQSLTSGLFFAFILVGCIGVLSVTSEFGSGSIRSTMAAVPRRVMVVAAKAVAVSVFALALGAVLVLGITVAVAVFAAAQNVPVDFGAGEVWQMLGTNMLMVAAAALMGLGLGLILRSSAGAIVALAALLFVGPMAVDIIATFVQDNTAVQAIRDWQFGALLDSSRDFGQMPGVGDDVSRWAAGLGLTAWLAVALGAGGLLFHRRDV